MAHEVELPGRLSFANEQSSQVYCASKQTEVPTLNPRSKEDLELRVCPTLNVCMLRDVDVARQTYSMDAQIVLRVFVPLEHSRAHPDVREHVLRKMVLQINGCHIHEDDSSQEFQITDLENDVRRRSFPCNLPNSRLIRANCALIYQSSIASQKGLPECCNPGFEVTIRHSFTDLSFLHTGQRSEREAEAEQARK